jgi:MFS family permease
MGITLSEWAFLLSAFLLGAFNAMLTPTFNAMAMKLAPQSRSGAAASTYWLGFDFGMAIGMVAFGAIIDAVGYSGAFTFAAAYMVLFAVLVFFLLRKAVPLREMVNPEE